MSFATKREVFSRMSRKSCGLMSVKLNEGSLVMVLVKRAVHVVQVHCAVDPRVQHEVLIECEKKDGLQQIAREASEASSQLVRLAAESAHLGLQASDGLHRG